MNQLRVRRIRIVITIVAPLCLGICGAWLASAQAGRQGSKENPITGKQAFADYTQQKPGTFRKITLADLPEPHASKSVRQWS
jgi:hypothetical protein